MGTTWQNEANRPAERGKPSVVMVVMGYNQENSIGYAIDGAFRQDYDGSLTLVLSDDCSQDDTFLIMQRKAAAYQGPHKVILNRNKKNLGYAGNLCHAISLVDSDLVCKADGDDYSFSDRVSVLVQAFGKYPQAKMVSAAFKPLSLNQGSAIPDFAAMEAIGDAQTHIWEGESPSRDLPLGCVSMWRRGVFRRIQASFAAYRSVGEDFLLALVSRMYGDILFVRRELVCYVNNQINSTLVNAQVLTLREIYDYGKKWNNLVEERLAVLRFCLQWMREYLDSNDDLPVENRAWAERCYDLLKEEYQAHAAYCRYGKRGLMSNALHWLLHRDAPVSRIFPLRFKCPMIYVLKKLGLRK